jgi:hypothetical protein
MVQTATKCCICDRKPAIINGRCQTCDSKIKADTGNKTNFEKYVTYHGLVIGLEKRSDGKLHPVGLKRSPEHLPKTKTIDLNTYITGYDRSQIKKLKAAVLSAAGQQ